MSPFLSLKRRGAPRISSGGQSALPKRDWSRFGVIPLAFATLLLTGCATEPLTKNAGLTAPAAFKAPATTETTAPPLAQKADAFWLIFGDPVLDDLEARAMTRNTDVAIAAARVQQARALIRQARAVQLPQVSAGLQSSRASQTGQSPKASTLHAAGLDLGYEVDLSGRLSKATQAATLDASAAEDTAKWAQLLVQGAVAETYFALRALDEDRAIVAETLEAYQGTLSVTQNRYAAGDVAELDVVRLQTEVATTEAELKALDRQRAQVENALSLLVGDLPSTFRVEAKAWEAQPWAGAVPLIPAGLPSELLTRRPDVTAAEKAMQAAQKRVGIARAAWFPRLSLTASAGGASNDLSDIFAEGARNWSLTAIVAQAIFDGGQRKAGVELAQGDLAIAFAQYRQSVLVAFGDVENALSDIDGLTGEAQTQSTALAAARRALDLSQSRYKHGYVSQLEVLDAQRSYLRIRRQDLQVRAQQYQATVRLIRALGGDWTV
ncbi:efflux transporter outer membrane subunit [Asticcacaulis sp. DXS10W]|uniref:Efflux transporter outer membrane subunit n=1 Tax=Asticcacaulis currens TaxID=2984210 RepID=A0ABT5IB13_9CAUL|nr:efflux transporter outer membrane subunit [Asticcacaulis currens]MDC7693361.1 efflux transporter outer membrane subunit [Asticcacaulis currens]